MSNNNTTGTRTLEGLLKPDPIDQTNAMLESDQEKIEYILANMNHCQTVTNHVLFALNGFDQKLNELEKKLAPLRENTEKYTSAQKNIDSTILELNNIIRHDAVVNNLLVVDGGEADATSTLVPAPTYDIRLDWETFLDWITRIKEAQVFFQINNSFKNVHTNQKKLRELMKKAQHDCEQELEYLLITNERLVDVTKTAWPLSSDYELFPSAMSKRISMICKIIENPDAVINTLIQIRSKTLRHTLQNNQHCNPYEVQHHNKQQQLDNNIHHNNSKMHFYKPGTHKVLFHLDFFLKLLEMERELYGRFLCQSLDLHKKTISEGFEAIVEPSLELFVKNLQKVTKERSKDQNQTLIFLDIMRGLGTILPKYEVILDNSEQYERLIDLRRQFNAGCKGALSDYRMFVSTYTNKNQSKRAHEDGSTFNLTVLTVTFLKKLSEYKGVMDSVDFDTLCEEKGFEDAPSVTAAISMSVLKSLEENLLLQAKTYKNSTLAPIFLLNNYNYIKKAAIDAPLEVSPRFQEKYDTLMQSVRDDYIDASWGKALDCINADDAKEIKDMITDVNNVPAKAKKLIKTKISTFNELFEKIYSNQRKFSISDPELRSLVRNDNVELVVNRYKFFMSCIERTEFSNNKQKYIKYTVPVLETMLNNLFDENL